MSMIFSNPNLPHKEGMRKKQHAHFVAHHPTIFGSQGEMPGFLHGVGRLAGKSLHPFCLALGSKFLCHQGAVPLNVPDLVHQCPGIPKWSRPVDSQRIICSEVTNAKPCLCLSALFWLCWLSALPIQLLYRESIVISIIQWGDWGPKKGKVKLRSWWGWARHRVARWNIRYPV